MRKILLIATIIMSGCMGSYYTLQLDNEEFRLRPGDEINKIRNRLVHHKYLYRTEGDSEVLEYFCKTCSARGTTVILRFYNGRLQMIEKKDPEMVF